MVLRSLHTGVAVHCLVDGIVEQTVQRHTEFAVARPETEVTSFLKIS